MYNSFTFTFQSTLQLPLHVRRSEEVFRW